MSAGFFRALFLSLALWPVTAAQGEDLSSVPLSRLYHKYSEFMDMSAEDQRLIFPRYQLFSKYADPGAVKLFFTFEGEKRAIEVDKDGYLLFYPSKAMLTADPVVYVDQPKGTMRLNLSIGFKMGDALEFDSRLLHERVHKGFKLAKSLGGFMAMFAPSHSNLQLRFGPTCEAPKASFEHEGKRTSLMHGDPVHVVVPFKKNKKMRKGGKLLLSCPVATAELG